MKWILIFTLISSIACAQCVTDSSGVPSAGGDIMQGCTGCAQTPKWAVWQAPVATSTLSIQCEYFPPCDTIMVLLMLGCRWVVMDSCIVPPVGGSGCLFLMDIVGVADMQVAVGWDQPDSVLLYWQPSFMGMMLADTIADLDTLCPAPVWIDLPTWFPTLYWRMDTGELAEIPLSPGLHIEQSGDRRRLILVR